MRPVSDAEGVPPPLDAVIETARLASLHRYRLLSDTEMTGLSRVSREAAQSLRATHAAISFVDSSRVWFGGAFGFDRSEASRTHSFCDVVVRGRLPIVVPDGLVDPRFLNHELVRSGPGLRSYAGAPLIDRGGYTLGSMAVYSVQPDRFSTAVLPDLTGLATLVCDFLAEADSEDVRPVLAPVRRVQGWLGTKVIEVKAGAVEQAGLLVISIAKRSPAETMGLRPTDILHSIGGQPMVTGSDVTAALAERAAGSRIEIRFRRAGQWRSCEIEITPRPRTVRMGRAPK